MLLKKKKITALISLIQKSPQNPYHLVNPSPWPFFTASLIFIFLIGIIFYVHNLEKYIYLISYSFPLFIYGVFIWWNDIIKEGTFEGYHTKKVQKNLKLGMLLFIVSEICFFFGFFWAFLSSSISPNIGIGCTWPPINIVCFSPWGIPLLNTIILLSSGITVTYAHKALLVGNRIKTITGLIFTVFYGIIFTVLQIFEYITSLFAISDNIYGSTFFILTGCHGFHVLFGTIFLLICLIRQILYHFTQKHHIGIELAIWYWHFVDIVWLFLFVLLYWWGGGNNGNDAIYWLDNYHRLFLLF